MPHPIRPLAVLSLLAALTAAPVGCAPTCDSPAAASDSDNPDNEPSECGGLCRPDRCPAGYYYSGPPNCSCLPKK